MQIKSLEKIAPDTLYEAFAAAFADYGMDMDRMRFDNMMKRRGFDPTLSFAAFDGERIAAFPLTGIGFHEGCATAYDTGTGTLPQYRGRGLAGKIFEYAVPHLKRAGIRQYLLEVLQHNAKALAVYRRQGFGTAREFNYFIHEKVPVAARNLEVAIRHIAIDSLSAFEAFEAFEDFPPSWQNSGNSIRRAPEAFVCLGAFLGERPVGYCVLEPATGDIPRIAVEPQLRRQGIGTELLREAIAATEGDKIRIINTGIRDDALTGFLAAHGIPVTGRQFEMVREL